jgi:hypothetical protein
MACTPGCFRVRSCAADRCTRVAGPPASANARWSPGGERGAGGQRPGTTGPREPRPARRRAQRATRRGHPGRPRRGPTNPPPAEKPLPHKGKPPSTETRRAPPSHPTLGTTTTRTRVTHPLRKRVPGPTPKHPPKRNTPQLAIIRPRTAPSPPTRPSRHHSGHRTDQHQHHAPTRASTRHPAQPDTSLSSPLPARYQCRCAASINDGATPRTSLSRPAGTSTPG